MFRGFSLTTDILLRSFNQPPPRLRFVELLSSAPVVFELALGSKPTVILRLPSLKLAAKAPENRPKRPKRKGSSSNHLSYLMYLSYFAVYLQMVKFISSLLEIYCNFLRSFFGGTCRDGMPVWSMFLFERDHRTAKQGKCTSGTT